MAEQIRRKKLSPVELAAAHLSRIKSLDPKLNAFVQVDEEGVHRQARAAESALDRPDNIGPLHGVPVSIKSSIEVSGMRWEAGTKLRAGIVGSWDAPLVQRLRNAGAIILGTTNTPELLMAWRPTIFFTEEPTTPGTCRTLRAVRAAAKQQPSLPDARPVA